MATYRQPKDPELYEAVVAFVGEARSAYRRVVDESTYLPKDASFPKMTLFEKSGFPNISPGINADVPKYDSLFGLEESRWIKIGFGDWDSWGHLVAVAESRPRLLEYLAGSRDGTVPNQEPVRRFWLIAIQIFALGIFDRLMHIEGIDFDEDALLTTYLPVEAGILDEQLPVAFLVPIALTKFNLSSDEMRVGSNALLIELNEASQLARMPTYLSNLNVNSTVLGAATHALVLDGWRIPNPHQFGVGSSELDWYPLDVIDRFFQALRIATGSIPDMRRYASFRSAGRDAGERTSRPSRAERSVGAIHRTLRRDDGCKRSK